MPTSNHFTMPHLSEKIPKKIQDQGANLPKPRRIFQDSVCLKKHGQIMSFCSVFLGSPGIPTCDRKNKELSFQIWVLKPIQETPHHLYNGFDVSKCLHNPPHSESIRKFVQGTRASRNICEKPLQNEKNVQPRFLFEINLVFELCFNFSHLGIRAATRTMRVRRFKRVAWIPC